MIYPYVKANPLVLRHLNLENAGRVQSPDGNYYLWKFDLLPLGGNNEETFRRLGARGLSRAEVRQEQQGEATFPLPTAEDEAFILPDGEPAAPSETVGNESETQE